MQAGEESIAANVGDELTQDGSTLRVGDAVEVHLDVGKIADRGGDRVGRGELILFESPILAQHEAGPRVGELCALSEGEVAHELGEGLVEPQIVPPLHCHKVAEPHMGELVEDRVRASLKLSRCWAGTEHVGVAEGDAPGVLHGSSVVLRNEDLIVLREGVGDAVLLLEECEALAGGVDDALRIKMLDERGTAPDAEVDGAPIGRHQGVTYALIRACDDRRNVGRHLLRFGETVDPTLPIDFSGRGRGVRENGPARRCCHRQGESRFEVGLLEGRVHAPSIRDLEL